MTQTTAVWVESILETELHLIPLMVGVDDDSAEIGGMDAAARIIAAEIDRLTAERDEAQLLRDQYMREANEERDEVVELCAAQDALKSKAARLDVQYEIANRESALHAKQRDEARAEVERLRPRPVDDGATGVPNEEDILAWDGKVWHKAQFFRYRHVEAFLDDDYYDDLDNDGVAWMREGFYVTTPVARGDIDFEITLLREPVTHWMPMPAPMAAARAREARK